MKFVKKSVALALSLCFASSSIPPALAADITLHPGAANLVKTLEEGNQEYSYAAQMANEMVPAAIHQILEAYPSLRREFLEMSPAPVKLAVKSFTGQSPNAFVMNLNSGEWMLAYNVSKHMNQLPPPLGGGVQKDVRKLGGVQSIIVHECTHLVFLRVFNDIPTTSWFNEGIAEATASGIAWNSEASPDNALQMLKREALNSGSGRASYGQGYFAVMYIGWMAGGRKSLSEVSPEEFEQSIKDGLNNLFERMTNKRDHGAKAGVIFQEAVQETTGKTPWDIVQCFGPKLEGSEPHIQEILGFMKDLATVTGSMKENAGGLAAARGLKTPKTEILDYTPEGKEINYSPVYPFGISDNDGGTGPVKIDLFDEKQNPLPEDYVAPPQTPSVKISNYDKNKEYDGKPIENPTLEQLDIKNADEKVQLAFEWYTTNEKGEWVEKLESAPSEPGTYNLIVKAGVPNAEGKFPSVIWGQTNMEGIVIGAAEG